MLNMSKLQRALVSAAIFAVSFALAYGLRDLVPAIRWPTFGLVIAATIYLGRAGWIAARHGPRALLHH